MKKIEFMTILRKKLKKLPLDDRKRILDYYSEIIDDKIDGGEDEESAVESVGSVDDIANQSLGEKAPKKPKNVKSIVLIAVGSPLWVPLLIAMLAIALSIYIVVWSVVFSVAVTVASVIVSAPVGVVFAFVSLFTGKVALGFLMVGACLFVFGIAFIVLLPTIKLVKKSAFLTKISVLRVIKSLVGGRVKI